MVKIRNLSGHIKISIYPGVVKILIKRNDVNVMLCGYFFLFTLREKV